MANKKISQLTSIGGTPSSGDIIPITDISDTTGSADGTTKKVTVAEMMSAVSVDGTGVTSTGETGATKFLREDGDGTCSFQTVAVTDENLRGTDNPHIGAFPNQSLKVLSANPPGSAMLLADNNALKFVVKAGADVFVIKGSSSPSRLAEASELPSFSISKDSGEPDIELTDSDGEIYSVVNGDSDTLGANGLPARQGYQVPNMGANPSPLLISGGTIS